MKYVIVVFPMIVRGICPPLPKGHLILDLETELIPEGVELGEHPEMFPRVRMVGIGYRGRHNNYNSCRRGSYLGNYVGIIDVSPYSSPLSEDRLDRSFCEFIISLLGKNIEVHAWNVDSFEKIWFKKHGFDGVSMRELMPGKKYSLLKYDIENELYRRVKFPLVVSDEDLDRLSKKIEAKVLLLMLKLVWHACGGEVKRLENLVSEVIDYLEERGYEEESRRLWECPDCWKKWGAFVGSLSEVFRNPNIDEDTKIELAARISWKNAYDVTVEALRLLKKAQEGEVRELEVNQASHLLEILSGRPNITMTFLSYEESVQGRVVGECRRIMNEDFVKVFRRHIPEIEEYSEESENEVNEFFGHARSYFPEF
jgi:hypothetical protein